VIHLVTFGRPACGKFGMGALPTLGDVPSMPGDWEQGGHTQVAWVHANKVTCPACKKLYKTAQARRKKQMEDDDGS
jgi:hypothetical protein